MNGAKTVPARAIARSRLEAALAAHLASASLEEAAQAHGLSRRTLAAYRAEGGSRRAKDPRASKRAPGRPRGAASPMPAEERIVDEPLLDTLAAELRYARAARRRASTDATKRQWSGRVESLVRTLEKLSPPAPVPPDAVREEQRRLDTEGLALIEQFLADAIKPEEIVAAVARAAALRAFADKLEPALADELRALLEPENDA